MECAWLREHGLISSYDDYVALPLPVLEDALLVMEADILHRQSEARKSDGKRR